MSDLTVAAKGLSFQATAPRQPVAPQSEATAAIVDGKGASVEAPLPKGLPVAEAPAAKTGSAAKIGAAAALGVMAVTGGMAMMPATANAMPVSYVCTNDAFAAQHVGLLNHMATLFASPSTGFNPAAGMYDGDAGIFSQANNMTRFDGNQAYKNLSCNHPVRFYSPTTGWVKFNNLNSLDRYVQRYGMPWDQEGAMPLSHGVPSYNSQWYDSSFVGYNEYNPSASFWYGVNAPSYQYYAPPASAPSDPWASPSTGTQAPADPWATPSAPAPSQAPADPWSNPAPTHTAPADPWGAPASSAPADPWK